MGFSIDNVLHNIEASDCMELRTKVMEVMDFLLDLPVPSVDTLSFQNHLPNATPAKRTRKSRKENDAVCAAAQTAAGPGLNL